MTDAPLIAILDDEPDIRRLLAAALEDAGFRTAGFGGGRKDVWQPSTDVNWGPEREWLATSETKGSRYSGSAEGAGGAWVVGAGVVPTISRTPLR